MACELKPEHVLSHLNALGYYNITGEQLKEFMRGKYKFICRDLLSGMFFILISLILIYFLCCTRDLSLKHAQNLMIRLQILCFWDHLNILNYSNCVLYNNRCIGWLTYQNSKVLWSIENVCTFRTRCRAERKIRITQYLSLRL